MIEQTKDKIIIDKWGEDVHFLNAIKTMIKFYQDNRGNHLEVCEVDVKQSDDKERFHVEESYRQHDLDISMTYYDVNHKLQDNVSDVKDKDDGKIVQLINAHELKEGYSRFYTKINGCEKELGQVNTETMTKKELKEMARIVLMHYNRTFETNYDNCYVDDELLYEIV
ncbi:hypothetical protein JRU67_09220 [Mammaliicoccus sciuri]|uniref:Uncharacterized protein n=1 Tax=Mammaliicoccus sciuri TaxID=1296 RepID=A0AB37HHS5_MAMSC|nr:hypothetical protein [Mammaliicoccus sciuri]QRN90242.1 hypothetical protein JRU67_09220 [Mammaliicoccus sciuri]